MLRSFRLSKFRRKSRGHADAQGKEEEKISLHLAASLGEVEKVKTLLANGAKVNMLNEHGNTALHEAAWKGYSQTVEVLCKHGADIYIKNKSGFSALHLTCQNGHNQSCRVLLLAGCKAEIKNSYGDTPLHTAARYGHAGVARILISAHSNVNETNKNGDTALHISSAMGRSKLTQIILSAGCDSLIQNKQRETALEIARRKRFLEIELMLLRSSNRLGKRCNKFSETSQSSSTDKLEKCSKTPLKRRGSGKVPKIHKHCLSPYGCHMFPDASSFPSPKLDSLPIEPLTSGEQYYIDLAGNIKKGPTGYGHNYCCKPFFRHMEKVLEREKSYIMNQVSCAHKNLSTRIDSLERRTQNYLQSLCHTVEDKLNSEKKQCLGRYEKHSKCKTHDNKNKFSKALDLHSVSHHNLGVSMNPDTETSENRGSAAWNASHQHRSHSEETLTKLNSNSEIPSAMCIADSIGLAASEDNLLERMPYRREVSKYFKWPNSEFRNQPKYQSNIYLCQTNHCTNKENLGASLYDSNSNRDTYLQDVFLGAELPSHVQLNNMILSASQRIYSGLNNRERVKQTLPATCV